MSDFWKKVISFIWPQTKIVYSKINGSLEIMIYNGKKYLNSKNTNYSFGALQRILEYGLEQIEIRRIHSVLLLGLGGGCLITSLRKKFDFKGYICAVEIDKKIILIAEKEFNILPSEMLTIKNADAFTFVQKHTQQYDLVVVDLFIDNEVPAPFYSKMLCQNVAKLVKEKGYLLFNLGIEELISEEKAEKVASYFKENHFNTKLFTNVERTNYLLIGIKK